MKVLVLSIVLCCVSAGAFLVQTQPLHQSTPGQQSLQILTKTLLSLTNHSGKAKSNIYTALKLKTLMRKDGIKCFLCIDQLWWRRFAESTLLWSFPTLANVSCIITAPWRTPLSLPIWNSTWWSVTIQTCFLKRQISAKISPMSVVVQGRNSKISVSLQAMNKITRRVEK